MMMFMVTSSSSGVGAKFRTASSVLAALEAAVEASATATSLLPLPLRFSLSSSRGPYRAFSALAAFTSASASAPVGPTRSIGGTGPPRLVMGHLPAPGPAAGTVAAVGSAAPRPRSHYTYSGPGRFGGPEDGHDGGDGHENDDNEDEDDEIVRHRHRHRHAHQPWTERGFTVGIGGPVGSGKTALVLALIKRLADPVARAMPAAAAAAANAAGAVLPPPPLGVVTNDIFTQEDAQFLARNQTVLDGKFIRAVETGGCPHAAIREDVSANLTACEDLTRMLLLLPKDDGDSGTTTPTTPTTLPPLILCESGGDNLAANFSRELADLTVYVIDVAGGDKVPRKGGPGITQSDLLVINKIDLADAVGADLGIMRRDAEMMRQRRRERTAASDDGGSSGGDPPPSPLSGPVVFASVRHGTALDEIETFILNEYRRAVASTTAAAPAETPVA